MVTELDAAWAAGFLDGEGCFTITTNTGGYMLAMANAVNTKSEPLLKLASLFGGGVFTRSRRNPAHKQIYAWQVQGAGAAEVARIVRPYLTVKGEQADVLIEFQETMSKTRAPIAQTTLLKRMILKGRIQKLNLRGA